MKAGAWPSEPLRCSPLRGRTRLKLKPADDEWAINRLHLAAQAARGNAKRNGWRSPALAAAIIAGDDFTRHFLAGRPRQARSRRPRKFHSIAAIASGANAPGSTNGSFIASRPTRREAQHALPCARKGLCAVDGCNKETRPTRVLRKLCNPYTTGQAPHALDEDRKRMPDGDRPCLPR
jgi:hypothetical protein